MSAKPTYNPGNIYLVRMHPSYGVEMRKFRPCVIVFPQVDPRFITIAPLTTSKKIINPKYELSLTPSPSNHLEKDCLILTWYLQTIDISRLQKSLGKLDTLDLKRLNNSLVKLFC